MARTEIDSGPHTVLHVIQPWPDLQSALDSGDEMIDFLLAVRVLQVVQRSAVRNSRNEGGQFERR
jgi:hypothetical protein